MDGLIKVNKFKAVSFLYFLLLGIQSQMAQSAFDTYGHPKASLIEVGDDLDLQASEGNSALVAQPPYSANHLSTLYNLKSGLSSLYHNPIAQKAAAISGALLQVGMGASALLLTPTGADDGMGLYSLANGFNSLYTEINDLRIQSASNQDIRDTITGIQIRVSLSLEHSQKLADAITIVQQDIQEAHRNLSSAINQNVSSREMISQEKADTLESIESLRSITSEMLIQLADSLVDLKKANEELHKRAIDFSRLIEDLSSDPSINKKTIEKLTQHLDAIEELSENYTQMQGKFEDVQNGITKFSKASADLARIYDTFCRLEERLVHQHRALQEVETRANHAEQGLSLMQMRIAVLQTLLQETEEDAEHLDNLFTGITQALKKGATATAAGVMAFAMWPLIPSLLIPSLIPHAFGFSALVGFNYMMLDEDVYQNLAHKGLDSVLERSQELTVNGDYNMTVKMENLKGIFFGIEWKNSTSAAGKIARVFTGDPLNASQTVGDFIIFKADDYTRKVIARMPFDMNARGESIVTAKNFAAFLNDLKEARFREELHVVEFCLLLKYMRGIIIRGGHDSLFPIFVRGRVKMNRGIADQMEGAMKTEVINILDSIKDDEGAVARLYHELKHFSDPAANQLMIESGTYQEQNHNSRWELF